MPMGIGPGLSVTRFESGIPGWMTGMDLGWDWVSNSKYNGAVDPTDTHSATIYAQYQNGVYAPFAANTLVRTDLGLQTVPTRTQLAKTTNNLLSASWSALNCTATSSAIVGFDGSQTLTLVTATTAGNRVQCTSAASASVGVTYACTFEMRAGSSNFGGIVAQGVSTASGAIFNLSTGAAVSVAGANAVSSTIRRGFNGNWFCTLMFTAAANESINIGAGVSDGSTYNLTIYPSASSGTVYAGTPQLEAGAFASPTIVNTGTSSATVNGNQQVVDLTGRLGSGVGGILQINQLESGSTLSRIVEFSDGTSNNGLRVYIAAPAGFACEVTAGGVNQGVVGGSTATQPAGMMTLAFAYSANFFTARVVGQADPTPDTVSTYPSGLSQLTILGRGFDAARNSYGQTRRLALRFGAQNASTFADLFAKATILNAVS